jgi:hypothetical protein
MEDLRRSHRERSRLVRERTAHINRMKGLLFAQGMRDANVKSQYKTLAVDKLLTVPTPTRPTQPTPTAHRIGRTRISPCIAVSPRSVAAQNHGCDLQEIGGNRE